MRSLCWTAEVIELPASVPHSFVVALIVGAILNLVDQGDALFGDASVNRTKIALTFAAPYCVATYGAVSYRIGMTSRRGRNLN